MPRLGKFSRASTELPLQLLEMVQELLLFTLTVHCHKKLGKGKHIKELSFQFESKALNFNSQQQQQLTRSPC